MPGENLTPPLGPVFTEDQTKNYAQGHSYGREASQAHHIAVMFASCPHDGGGPNVREIRRESIIVPTPFHE
jgi:hypothetical protein